LLLLGADVNENNSGNENRDSLGVAIKQAQLSITTSAGDFTFADFFTNTTASLRESGSKSFSDYFTLFGQAGSSQITGSSKMDISKLDDVLWFENIKYEGDIKSAKLSITFLPTPNSKPTEAESFFDFSGGFEDFALLSAADAILIEKANIGAENAPKGLAFNMKGSVIDAIAKAAENVKQDGGDDSDDSGDDSDDSGDDSGDSGDDSGDSGDDSDDSGDDSDDSGDDSGDSGDDSDDSGDDSDDSGDDSGDSGDDSGDSGDDSGDSGDDSGDSGDDSDDSGDGSGGASGSGNPDISSPPAAPAPPFVIAASMGLLMLWKKRKQGKSSDAE
jgi:hypothetical protein